MTQTASTLTGSVHHLCFINVNGEPVLAAARNAGLELIDPDDGSVLRVIAAERTANAIKPMPSAGTGPELLLAGGTDGVVYGYNPTDGTQVFARVLGRGTVKDLETFPGPDGPRVAAVLDSGVYVWSPADETAITLPDPPGLEASRLFKVCAYEWLGRWWLVCAYTDGFLATWDLGEPDAEPTVQPAHDGPIWSLISTVDGDGQPIVVSGGSDRRMRVWSPKDGAALQESVFFVADGTIRRLGHVSDRSTTMLLTASATGSVSLWRLDGPLDRPELDVSRHSGEAWALACVDTTDGVLIASGDMNGAISIKRLSTALLTEPSMRVVFQASTTIWALAHGDTVDGPYLAGAGVDQTVNVVDPSGRREPRSLPGHTSTVRALTAGGDRERPHLVSGGADHRVLDWDPRTGELRAELPMGHEGEVWALALPRDGNVLYVASAGADGTVRVLPLERGGSTVDSTTGSMGEPAGAVRVLATELGEVTTIIPVPADTGLLLAIGSGKGLRMVSLATGASRTLLLPGVATGCSVFDGGRHLLVVARQDGVVQLIDPIAGAAITRFATSYAAGQVRALESVEVAGTTFVLGGCDDGRIVVWHIDGTLVGNPIRGGTAGIRAMNLVRIAAGRRRSVDAASPGSESERASESGFGLESAQSALVTAGQDGTVRLWPVTVDSPLRAGGSVDRSVRAASVLLQDQPTGRDLLGRDSLVETLFDALTSPSTDPPVVVGVHAPWGQGKSSLLHQLRGRVDPYPQRTDSATASGSDRPPTHGLFLLPRKGRPRVRRSRGNAVRTRLTRAWAWGQVQRSGDRNAPLTYEMRPLEREGYGTISVWFNPWMYERTDQIWAGLTREILIAVTDRLSKAEQERLWFDLNLRRTEPAVMRRRILASYIPRTLSGLLVSALLAFVVAVAVVAMAVTAVNNPSIAGLLGPTALVMLTVLGTIAQLTSGSFKHIHGWVAPDELNSTAGPEHAWKGTTDPLTSTDRGYLYMLQHDVGEVVSLATRHAPLYVFIDDLDRCGPGIVADTIEAINLFLNKAFGQCVFVIALDPATVAAHLETAFKGINKRAIEDPMSFGHLRHTGWRFMEKIIDLPIRLPRVSDAALSNYLDRLLDTAVRPTAAPPTTPTTGARPAVRTPRQRGTRGDAMATADPVGEAAEAAGTSLTTVELVIVPERSSTARSVAAIGELEEIREVREALRAAVLSLPGRNPRQTKAFINLWRFYMVLDHRTGRFSPSLLAVEKHSIEMARLVELMVRWPYLLDPLGELAYGESAADGATNLDRLIDACDDDHEVWAAAARRVRFDHEDAAVRGLRELLRKAIPNRQVFAGIARRYL